VKRDFTNEACVLDLLVAHRVAQNNDRYYKHVKRDPCICEEMYIYGKRFLLVAHRAAQENDRLRYAK